MTSCPHRDATVVEVGSGLNTRHERVDNGRARWLELDLPDVIGLRRNLFADSPRRTVIAASVADRAWAAEVASHATGPYRFVAEAVLPYLHEPDVRGVIDLLAGHSPGIPLALDTAGPGFFGTQEQHAAVSKVEARMHWRCPGPAHWPTGGRVHAYWRHTPSPVCPRTWQAQLPLSYQQMVSAIATQRLPQAEGCRLTLLRPP
ncbi:class I SAM-dependent methyltransferase [Streptomyces buecherae]|uniref:class I SAM-dependent methyltransferase n=1 Tax=Streptomyces buecherae TaxID=2763006 RepID=UPI0036521954